MSPEEQIYQLVKENYRKAGNPLDYIEGIIKPLCIEQLNHAIACCRTCAIGAGSVHSRFAGTGNEPVLVIGEHPMMGQQGSEGLVPPYEGTPEGKLLLDTFHQAQADMSRFAWINVTNCMPAIPRADGSMGPRPPASRELQACRPFVDFVMRVVRPRYIILMGNTPLNVFFRGYAISKIHGKELGYNGIPVMPVLSPANIIRQGQMGRVSPELQEQNEMLFRQDIAMAVQAASMRFPEEKIMRQEAEKQENSQCA